jgi:lipopolysaccharide/colanic/teichoic acid biosynthesis glycosyltransferase
MHSESQGSETRLAEATAGAVGISSYVETHDHDHARATKRRGHQEPASLFRYQYLKRAMDILLVGLALPVLLVAILIVAAIVKSTSPGPIFFSHRRICRQGAFFSMWKFRTMCVNSSEVLEQYLAARPAAREEWNRTHKLKEDPRITRVGLFLRRYSLDELPQVWNVLAGRMSLVGPRPIVAAEVEKYGEFFDFYCRVKPGVTGLWQVSGRSKLTYDARVKLDCDYVTRWSLFRDLRILTATFKSVVNRDGAY